MFYLWFLLNVLLWQFNVELLGLKLGLNVVVLSGIGVLWILMKKSISRFSVLSVSVFIFLAILQLLIIGFGPCTDKFEKALVTMPILVLMTFIGLEIGANATNNDWLKLEQFSVLILLLALIGILIEFILPELFPIKEVYRMEGKFAGFYSEPSFVAYSLFPCVLILLNSSRKNFRLFAMIVLVFLFFLARSSTLILLIVVWLSYLLIRRRDFRMSIRILVSVPLFVFLASIINYELLVAPTLERIGSILIAGGGENLSGLALMQGWQDALSNLLRTYGLGLGFNMMGCSPLPQVPAREVLDNVFRLQINAEDGTAIFNKIVSEFGVLGFTSFVLLIFWWIRQEKYIRIRVASVDNRVSAILASLFFSFICTAIIRSPGYFSGSYFLLVVAAGSLLKKREVLLKISA